MARRIGLDGSRTCIRRARHAWGELLPEWVAVLAEACDRESQAGVARRLRVSPARVSQVLGATYPGRVDTVEAKVREAFMAETVACPVLGTLTADRCRSERTRPFTPSTALRVRLHRSCRACVHNGRSHDAQQ